MKPQYHKPTKNSNSAAENQLKCPSVKVIYRGPPIKTELDFEEDSLQVSVTEYKVPIPEIPELMP